MFLLYLAVDELGALVQELAAGRLVGGRNAVVGELAAAGFEFGDEAGAAVLPPRCWVPHVTR